MSVPQELSPQPTNFAIEDMGFERREMLIAGYEDYRTYCDNVTDGFRKVGIQDEVAYSLAVADSKTVFCRVDGRQFPLLAPIGYEDRYQVDRCQEMTGRQEVMLLALPLQTVRDGAVRLENLYGGLEFPADFAVVVEEIDPLNGQLPEERELAHQQLAELIDGLGNLEAAEFVNRRLRDTPENRTAWMGIFNFSITSARDETSPKYEGLTPDEALDLAWSDYCAERGQSDMPGEDADGTYLFTAQQLRGNPQIVEGLWKISEVGFGKVLGADHPMSMEVTREFFEQELFTEGVHTSVRYFDGKPVCFGSVALSMDHNDWLDCDSSSMQRAISSARDHGQVPVHFYELISDGPKGMSFSPDVLGLFLDLVGKTGRDYSVFFESTNLSATYIPMIVERQVDAHSNVEFTEKISLLGKLHYWYLKNVVKQPPIIQA